MKFPFSSVDIKSGKSERYEVRLLSCGSSERTKERLLVPWPATPLARARYKMMIHNILFCGLVQCALRKGLTIIRRRKKSDELV